MKSFNEGLEPEKGNFLIGEKIKNDKPLSILRLRTESDCLKYELDNNHPETYPSHYMTNGGLYPLTKKIISYYAKSINEGLINCDYFAYSCPSAYNIQNNAVNKIRIDGNIHNRSLEPFYFDDPWSKYLEGKKVLVIHPFTKSIETQYNIKDKLFTNKKILPNFDLKTLKSIQTSAGSESPYDSWVESLDYMLNEIKKYAFDIALLGCGCYDIPISDKIKNMGKQSIIIGGGLQILFGIKGKRWDRHSVISKLYNENWVRPSEEETPIKFNSVEGGCYW